MAKSSNRNWRPVWKNSRVDSSSVPLNQPVCPTSLLFPDRVKLSLAGIGAGLALGLIVAFLREFSRPLFHTAKEVSLRFGAPLVIGLPVVFTQSEKRRRSWKKTFEFMCGSVLTLAVGVAEFYVLKHP